MLSGKGNSVRWAKKAIFVCFLGIIIFAGLVSGQTEENAAVLYRKAFELYSEPSKEMEAQLSEFMSGDIELNDEIKSHVEKNRQVIDLVTEASMMEHCDWGHDYTQHVKYLKDSSGISSSARMISQLIWSDYRIQKDNGDFTNAINRCKTVYRLAGHITDRQLITYLVYIALGSVTNDLIAEILPEIQDDKNLLTTVKYELWRFSKIDDAFIQSFDFSTEWALDCLKDAETFRSRISELSMIWEPNDIPEMTDEFFEKSRDYYLAYRKKVRDALELPYIEARHKQQELWNQLQADKKFPNLDDVSILEDFDNIFKEAKTYLKAYFTKSESHITLLTNTSNTHLIHTRAKYNTKLNAFRTAVEVYLIRARTEKLPDSLPAGLPKDLYSGKDFIYEKTEEGFALKCQVKDLEEDEIYKYEFKVKK